MREIATSTAKGAAVQISVGASYLFSTIASVDGFTAACKVTGIVIGLIGGALTVANLTLDFRRKWLDRNRKFRNNIGKDSPRDGADE